MHVNRQTKGQRDGRRRHRWEEVYEETRVRILTLQLPPGAPLTEAGIANEFGISPTPARDALGRLCQEGLVVVGPRRGYSVAGLSLSDVSELAEARYVLQSGIVRLLIRSTSPLDLTNARALAKRLNEPGLTANDLIERSQEFNLAIAELTGNRRLVDALQKVLEASRRIFQLGIAGVAAEGVSGAHVELLDALERRDMDAALAISEQEAYGASERVVTQLIRNGGAEGRHLGVTRGSDTKSVSKATTQR